MVKPLTKEAERQEELKEWTAFLVEYSDLFSTDHCGYWLQGIEHGSSGWLAWEMDETTCQYQSTVERVVRLWKAGDPLPDGYFRIDAALAEKAFRIGEQKWGQDWYEQADSDSYDYVIQMALLEEQRYA